MPQPSCCLSSRFFLPQNVHCIRWVPTHFTLKWKQRGDGTTAVSDLLWCSFVVTAIYITRLQIQRSHRFKCWEWQSITSKFFKAPMLFTLPRRVHAGLHRHFFSLSDSVNPSLWPSLPALGLATGAWPSLRCGAHWEGTGRRCEDGGWWDCWGYGGDWNRLVDITLSPPVDKGPGKCGGYGYVCVCANVCLTAGAAVVSKGLWEIKKKKKKNPQIVEFGCHDPTPTPISCLNCLSVSRAPFHSTALSSFVHNHVDTWESTLRTSLSSWVNNDKGSQCDRALQYPISNGRLGSQ